MDIPETRFAKTVDGVYIAYQVVGEGPVDLVWQFDWFGNVDLMWEDHPFGTWLRGLSSFSRLILHDRRGTGLSSRNLPPPNLETRVADLGVVLDVVGSERPVLAGMLEGGAPNVLFAATEPERVQSIVWLDPEARPVWTPDYPWGAKPEYVEADRQALEHWGTSEYGEAFVQTEVEAGHVVPEFGRWAAILARHTATPDVALAIQRMWYETDVRAILPSVQVPALLIVLDLWREAREEAEYIASIIPRAELRLVAGDVDFGPEMQAGALGEIRRFLGVAAPAVGLDTVLSTVLFTDIVGSTQRAAELGDLAWRDLLGTHDRIAREQIDRFRGQFVHTTGDGLLATFDGPARSVNCARAIAEAVRSLGLEIRAGCHTGEVEVAGDDVQGITVHIGARIAALADASEVLVSSTVKDLTPGSGLTFKDAGEHELKGVPDRWHLYRVVK